MQYVQCGRRRRRITTSTRNRTIDSPTISHVFSCASNQQISKRERTKWDSKSTLKTSLYVIGCLHMDTLYFQSAHPAEKREKSGKKTTNRWRWYRQSESKLSEYIVLVCLCQKEMRKKCRRTIHSLPEMNNTSTVFNKWRRTILCSFCENHFSIYFRSRSHVLTVCCA